MVRYKLIFPKSGVINAFGIIKEEGILKPSFEDKIKIFERVIIGHEGFNRLNTYVDLLGIYDYFRLIKVYSDDGCNYRCFITHLPIDYIGFANDHLLFDGRFNAKET